MKEYIVIVWVYREDNPVVLASYAIGCINNLNDLDEGIDSACRRALRKHGATDKEISSKKYRAAAHNVFFVK